MKVTAVEEFGGLVPAEGEKTFRRTTETGAGS